ncbi:MAG: DsbA family oxidoreductase [Alphaproteobacteria bacterium]|nr:DsbA family oxidoreductase [Alphaproteobacteria bacterium]MDE2012571.1 DsbA family oxidoreductase [Alphaproteobacteria bacterium]MDE2073436.1 DsbA family oxidoreductase [Alphaproteobacteria bacterium]MDE2350948.1 DsbA family oxidoreductase [Alphaproteobacteria bacterium]
MQIDVISDTVCPWCFIGKRRLAKALAQRPDVPFDVRWRAYRLDPTIPPEGYERKAYLQAKFGDTERVKAAGETIRQLGESLGIRFAFESIERAPNTLDSHRLIRWAGTAGVQDEVVERLFSSYFEQGRDISDRSVLREIAAEAGMDAELVADLLAQDADSALVEREDTLAHQMGVTGVPTFIIANKYAASGAQEPEAFLQIIDKVLSEAAA